MSGLLEDRIAMWVSAHPESTFQEIRRAVPGQEKRIRDILGGPAFETRPRALHDRDRAMVYWLRGWPGRRLEAHKQAVLTHKARVLALLGDGQPHSHMEGYRLNVMLHSRVADLRRDGYRIDCWREGDNYLYQLRGTLDVGDHPTAEAPAAPPGFARPVTAPSGSPTSSGLADSLPPSRSDGAAQLSLTGPAFRKQAAA